MPINWFLTPERLPSARVRLFCLPYAGGSAAIYRDWAKSLAPDVELLAVQLPGRGWRWQEPPDSSLHRLAGDIALAIEALDDRPFAVFGHSMGAWLGLEVVRRLERSSRQPICFFASGRQAPSLGCRLPRLSHLDDSAFVRAIQLRYGGIPPEILAEAELLALFLPTLRADIAMLESYQHRASDPIASPIYTLLGERDTVVNADELADWKYETASDLVSATLPGGHFFFQPDPAPLLAVIRSRLASAGEPRRLHVEVP